MGWFVSESNSGFYHDGLRSNYEAAGGWPHDAIEISDDLYIDLRAGLDAGRVLHFSENSVALADRPPKTPDEIEMQKIAIVQEHMDAAARALRYDDIKTAVTYAEESAVPKFQAEGQALREWRSLVWATCYAILDEVNAGKRDVPTDEELISELPSLSLPT